jgi:mono/diheme cytochrome c family protein
MRSLAHKSRAFPFWLVSALAGMAIFVVAPRTEAHTQKNPLDGDPEAIQQGKSLYNNTCLFCHGSNGKGARAPNLVDGLFRPVDGADDAIVFEIILKGRPGTIMGGFEGTYDETQIWKIISYLRNEGREQRRRKK